MTILLVTRVPATAVYSVQCGGTEVMALLRYLQPRYRQLPVYTLTYMYAGMCMLKNFYERFSLRNFFTAKYF